LRQIGEILSVPDTTDLLGIRDRAILETLYSTGIRRIELTRLRLEDLNFERATLRVFGKGNKERVVPVGKKALHWLDRYLEEVRPRLVIRADVRALFLTGLGEAFPAQGLGQHVSALLRRAAVPKGGAHILRHTCATHLLEGGADQRYIQQLLGHASADTTALYAQVSIIQLQQVHARCHPAERQRPTGENLTGDYPDEAR
jgi:integrase/recombinase XerD